MSNFNVGDYDSGNENAGAYFMNNLWDTLKDKNGFNIYNGYEVNMHLTGKVRP